MADSIIVRGAREHNLKNVSIELPRDQLIVMTGLSGSGKSSLAFDTIYAEGQRRYVESLSAYARQFLGEMSKPDVDHIDGLSPAISIDQKTTSRNPRSTVGTQTEIYDYLRVLFARVGHPHCSKCGEPVTRQSSQQIIEQAMKIEDRAKFLILSPLVRGRKGEFKQLLEGSKRDGYSRVRIDGEIRSLDEEIELDKKFKHTIEVVVDRLVMKEGLDRRVADSVETALTLSGGTVILEVLTDDDSDEEPETLVFSEEFACASCGHSFPELEPRIFSFNTPYGACEKCTGLGTRMEVDPDRVVPDKQLSLEEGCVEPWGGGAFAGYYLSMLNRLSEHYHFSISSPWEELPKEVQNVILYGSEGERVLRKRRGRSRVAFEGVIPSLLRKHRETESDRARDVYEEYMTQQPCPECHGARLQPETLGVTIGGKNIAQFTNLTAADAVEFLSGLTLSEKELNIARRVIKEIAERLEFMVDVGLDYLTLDRGSATLSGGESQRIRLATQIGSSLVGVVYILDEPSIGLHARDNARLIVTLERLKSLGNTLIVVEHDEETMKSADHVVDIGPGAGEHGGEIVAQGTYDDILKEPRSITGQYLSGKREIAIPQERRRPERGHISIKGAAQHNLKNLDVDIPIGLFTCVTGVSGSGKSTLIRDILYPSLARRLYRTKASPGKHKEVIGWEAIDKVIDINQSPIGRTPRSNPATYTGVFDDIRKVFSQTQESRMRGYQPGRFSFNVRGGRCEACRGDGTIKIEMHFLPDVYVPCEVCKGARYNAETLEVKYKGKNIADVLSLSVEEAAEFFSAIPKISRRMETLKDVGLGYIRLGQPATTLSGGEAQRVKLSTELSKRATGRTMYMLDEPTTGLHFADIEKLLHVLQRLVDTGNTVLVIEHNLDVIKTADWLIDLGPEGGAGGGKLVAAGPPEDIVKEKKSYTGKFLKPILKKK